MTDALSALASGRIVAAATESFFGLLADAGDGRAIDALLALKPRGAEKGMPVLLPHADAWSSLVTTIPEQAQRLAAAFWPGPLTIALDANPGVDRRLTLDGKIGVRLPGASPAAELARRSARVLTATSANLPGQPPLSDPLLVEREFRAAVAANELVVFPQLGPSAPMPSTVVVVTAASYRVAREGAISRAAVASVLGAEAERP